MKTTDIIDHFTELDRSILKGEDAYVEYFNYMRRVFTILIDSFNSRTLEDPEEINILKSFVQKFLNTIEALRLKYLYEQDYQMKIDLTDSSFPNHIELRNLEADMVVRDEELKKMPTEEALKRATLDYLFQEKEEPYPLLRQLGKLCYFKMLKKDRVFTTFQAGELVRLNEGFQKDTIRQYLFSWASYDSVTNRPFVYILIFDHNDHKNKLMGNKAAFLPFVNVCKKFTHNSGPLNVVARDIDEALEDVHPKVLKRIDLGPLYGAYSKDNHQMTNVIQKHFKQSEFVFLFTTEIVFSIGEKKSKGILSTDKLRQIFFVDESNKDCLERHVSQVDKFLLASHGVVQHLTEYHREYIDKLTIPPITYTEKEG
ncbi:MAG: hypothetical protein HKN92_02665 [Chitinophagales bacterium]|nr:hypothetical protein [Chitinophagales bacterium]